MPERTFFLKPQPPVRAFLIAAVLSIVGAVLTVAALQGSWHVALVVLGILALAAGIALFVGGLVAMARLGVTITLSDDGYRVSGTGQSHEGQWADVTKVTQSTEAAHVTIYHGNVRRTHLIFPGGPAEGQMQAIIDEIMARLERAKG